MIFKHYQFKWIALAGALVAFLFFHVGNHFKLPVNGILFTMSMVILGIPHGAVDHLIDKKTHGSQHKYKFYAFYLSSILLMSIIWLISEALGFILFLVITVYHFGSTDVQKLNLQSEAHKKLVGILRGFFIVVMLLIANPHESFRNISNIIGKTIDTPAWIHEFSSLIIFVNLFAFILVISSMYSYNVMCKEVQEFFLDSLLLTILFISTSTTVGFAIYFALWHSLKHIEEVYEFNANQQLSNKLIHFFKDALPFSLISFVGLAGLYAAFSYFDLSQSIVSVSLILISALTLPHVVIVEQFYAKR